MKLHVVQVAHKTGRICQGGTQNRCSGAIAAAVEYMKQGNLGDVKLARSIVYGGRGSIGGPGTFEIPAQARGGWKERTIGLHCALSSRR